MIKLNISKTISFCFGVKRTISLINELLETKKYKTIYMLGEVVHNEHVISDLKRRGLKLIKNFNNIPVKKDGILVIQSHGVSPDIYEQLERKKIKYIDSTCTLVKKIHCIAEKIEKQGYFPVIVGNRNHTEVRGISGYIKKYIVIRHAHEINKGLFKNIDKIGVLFQSTFIQEQGHQIIKKLKPHVKELKIFDTICNPTKLRQKELKMSVKKNDCVIVIGSKTSANTNHLFDIAKNLNKSTFFIEKPEDINKLKLNNYASCFVTSGASTPEHIIEHTIQNIYTRTNSFIEYSEMKIPIIDKAINEFFINKKRSETYHNPIIKQIWTGLQNFAIRPGKRLRPLLLLLTYSGFLQKSGKTQLKSIIDISTIIELMHSFLLIHDDIMDKAEFRRGEPSLHTLFNNKFISSTHNKNIGEDIALVAGDILFAGVLNTIARVKMLPPVKDRFLSAFSKCYELTGFGQILDSISSLPKKLRIDNKLALNISQYKTAYYTIYYPILFGYLLTEGNNPALIKKIEEFSIPLGIAFQIRDDIIGVFGKQEKTGKSDISDIDEGKYTLLINTTIKNLKHNDLTRFKKLFTNKNKTLENIAEIKKIIIQSNAEHVCRKEMCNLLNKSREMLKYLKLHKKEKLILTDFIEYIHRIEL